LAGGVGGVVDDVDNEGNSGDKARGEDIFFDDPKRSPVAARAGVGDVAAPFRPWNTAAIRERLGIY